MSDVSHLFNILLTLHRGFFDFLKRCIIFFLDCRYANLELPAFGIRQKLRIDDPLLSRVIKSPSSMKKQFSGAIGYPVFG